MASMMIHALARPSVPWLHQHSLAPWFAVYRALWLASCRHRMKTFHDSMDSPTLPFSIRYRKPFWLLICSDTGRTAVYNVHGALMAEHGSDELVAFAAENFVEIFRWSEVPGSMRPRQMAGWMTKDAAARYFLFALRSVDTETRTVIATPDA